MAQLLGLPLARERLILLVGPHGSGKTPALRAPACQAGLAYRNAGLERRTRFNTSGNRLFAGFVVPWAGAVDGRRGDVRLG